MSSENNSINSIFSEKKLDLIFNSVNRLKTNVLNLTSTVDDLKKEHDILKRDMKDKIREVCLQMIQTNNVSTSVATPSLNSGTKSRDDKKSKKKPL